MVILTQAEYRDRVLGGWLGRLMGSAVGLPGDGQRQALEVRGDPEQLLRAQGRLREGAELGLVWLRALQRRGPAINSDDLIAAWLRHVTYSQWEYGYARANFLRDLRPPLTGVHDNPFRGCLGALARADLWGMVAPGDPEVAARYACQDAMLDHSGPGLEAAIALAAMVSAAFVTPEPPRLLEVALAFLPDDSRVSRAVRDVRRWHGELAHWRRTREMLLRAYSADDVRDAAVAAGLLALALLDGNGDLERTLLTAAEGGWSTAAVCAAAGAILGVALGAEQLPLRWREPLRGELTLGPGVVALPRNLRAPRLADQICDIGRLVCRAESAGRVQIVAEPTQGDQESTLPELETASFVRQLALGPYVTAHRRGPLEVRVDYDGPPTIGYNTPRRLALAITNSGARSLDISTRLSAPAGFVVTGDSEHLTLPEGGTVSFRTAVSAPEEHAQIAPANPCTLFLSVEDGLQAVVPITLVGESLWYAAGPYAGFDEAHAPEQPGIISGDSPIGGDGWRRLSVSEPSLSLLAGLEGEQGTYYLATDLWMPRTRRARLRIGCNDGVKVWLNGQQVLCQHEHRPVSPLSADELEIELREEWNRLLIKMAQCSPRRFLAVTFRDPDRHLLVEAANTWPRRA